VIGSIGGVDHGALCAAAFNAPKQFRQESDDR